MGDFFMSHAIKLELESSVKPGKMMQPNMVVPKGADRPRLPKGYEEHTDGESCEHLGDVCPGCGH